MRLLHTIAPILLVAACSAENTSTNASPLHGTFRFYGQEVDLDYEMVNGDMIFGGDEILDPADKVDAADGTRWASFKGGTSLAAYRWPNATIFYTIAGSVSSAHKTNIAAAMKEWESKTPITFVPRTNEAAYTTFEEPTGQKVCAASAVGYNGAQTYVKLRDTSTCNLGVLVHEIGHIIGFQHEHQRSDRDSYVVINSNCVPSGSNAYGILSANVLKVGAYDLASTMHYRSTTLNAPGCSGTSDSETAIYKKGGALLTQDWSTLSSGDIAATNEIYCKNGKTETTGCASGFEKTCSNNTWSACECIPATTKTCVSPDCCGTCGHATQTCTANHTWTTGVCQNGC